MNRIGSGTCICVDAMESVEWLDSRFAWLVTALKARAAAVRVVSEAWRVTRDG